MDLDERRTLGHVQLRREMAVGLDGAEAAHLVDDLVAHRRHRLGEALQRRHVLERLRLRHEGALAVQLEQQSFLLEIAERLAHRDAADVEHRAEFVLGRHPAVRRIGAVQNACAQRVLDLHVERGRRQRHDVGEVIGQLVMTRSLECSQPDRAAQPTISDFDFPIPEKRGGKGQTERTIRDVASARSARCEPSGSADNEKIRRRVCRSCRFPDASPVASMSTGHCAKQVAPGSRGSPSRQGRHPCRIPDTAGSSSPRAA